MGLDALLIVSHSSEASMRSQMVGEHCLRIRAYIFCIFCLRSSILFLYSRYSIFHSSMRKGSSGSGRAGGLSPGRCSDGRAFQNSPAPVYSLATYSAMALVVLVNSSAPPRMSFGSKTCSFNSSQAPWNLVELAPALRLLLLFLRRSLRLIFPCPWLFDASPEDGTGNGSWIGDCLSIFSVIVAYGVVCVCYIC